MSITTQRWILLGLGAFLLAGCGGSSGGGKGDQGAKPPAGAPIFEDLASALDRNSDGIDSITKIPQSSKGNTDGISRPRPNDLGTSPRRDAVTPLPNPVADLFDTPTNPTGINIGGPGKGNDGIDPQGDPSKINQRPNDAGIAIGGAGKGVGDGGDVTPGDPGRLNGSRPGNLDFGGIQGEPAPETRNTADWISHHVLPDAIGVGHRTEIPPTIDPPHDPVTVPPTLTSSKGSFDPWIIPRPPGGSPPPDSGPYNAFASEGFDNNDSAIRAGGPSKKGSGEEEPVPEPETVILMLLGLAAIGYFYKK